MSPGAQSRDVTPGRGAELNDGSKVRELPGTSPEKRAAQKAREDAYAAKLRTGGFDEALIRAVLYVIAAERALDARSAFAISVAHQKLMARSLEAFKALVREQFFVLCLNASGRSKRWRRW